jgi:phosphoribosylglycinamide formyltransferase 1
MELRLGFLASERGSGVEAILRNIYNGGSLKVDPRVVITNNQIAGVLEVAKNYSLDSYVINDGTLEGRFGSRDGAILDTLSEYGVNMVLLSGYMKKLGGEVVRAFPNRVLNIHPAIDLKRFGGKGMYGLRVHEAVLDSGERKSGATVHLVDEEYDHGPIVSQVQVDVYAEDTPESLQARVLRYEHVLYSQVLRDISEGRIDLESYSELDFVDLDEEDIPF